MDASRHLNPFLEDKKIKLEGLDVREQILRHGDFQTKADLDSGYRHVPLFEGHKKFVGCHFLHQDGKYFFFGEECFISRNQLIGIILTVFPSEHLYLKLKLTLNCVVIQVILELVFTDFAQKLTRFC